MPTFIRLFVLLCLFCISVPSLVVAADSQQDPQQDSQQEEECNGPYKYKKVTDQEIANVLQAHYLYLTKSNIISENSVQYKAWLKSRTDAKLPLPSKDVQPKEANLCGAKLDGAMLQHAILEGAKLHYAQLIFANLKHANLIRVNLQDAFLIGANLQNTNIRLAYLQRANLENAKLQEANLSEANMRHARINGANLQNAKITNANLQNALLGETNLQQVNLSYSELQDANLTHANLKNANLSGAKLHKAYLGFADFTDANLEYVQLNEAVILNTNFQNASFIGVDLTGSFFRPVSAPKSGQLTNLKGLITVNLDVPDYRGDEYPSDYVSGLVMLRKSLKEAGLRDLEREATFVIENWRTRNAPPIDRWFKTILFEYTTGYGLYYERPLYIIAVLWVVFASIYIVPLKSNRQSNSGIYRVWADDDDNPNKKEKLSSLPMREVITSAFYFSLITAFHVGWRDLNVGTWISRVHPKDFTMHAKGWVKSVSGIQSLISVYMLAMWALTYFGRPFE